MSTQGVLKLSSDGADGSDHCVQAGAPGDGGGADGENGQTEDRCPRKAFWTRMPG